MGVPGKRMRLGTKSCAECRRRKVRCIVPPGQDRCDACRAHGSSCVPQEKQPRDGGDDASPPPPPSGADDVAALKKRLDELEALMRGMPGDMLPRQSGSVHGTEAAGLTDGSTAASALSDGPSPPSAGGEGFQPYTLTYPSLLSTAQIIPAFQNSPLLSLFNESSIFDSIGYTDTSQAPLTPGASSRLRRCLAEFAPYLPRPERVAAFFAETQQYWLIWPPYFYGPGDADRLGPGQVPLAEQTFHSALVSGQPGQTAKAVLFLALCIQQTPKRTIQSLVPPSVRQQDLVDTYVETAQALLQLDAEAGTGGTLDGVEAMNMLYKLCINAGRPLRAWSWNRQAITTSLCCGLPARAARATERAAQAWSMAWRAERYMAMTLGLPSSTSALHPGLTALQDENAVATILHYLAVVCGRIIDRDQSHNADGTHYATTVQLGEEMEAARRRLFPAHWWAARHLAPGLDQATGWFRQSCKVIFLTALQLVHLPYLLRAAADARYLPSRDAAMRAARDTCEAYCDFRRWPRGGGELCQVMDFRAFSAALVLVLGHWIAPGTKEEEQADVEQGREVALCLRQTAAVMECRVAEQAVLTLDALDAARRGVYMANDDYEVVVPYFGRIRINKDVARPGQRKQDVAAAEYFNTVEFNTNEFLADFQFDVGDPAAAAMELCCDWTELRLGYAGTDWSHSFTCGPFFDVEGAGTI